MKILAIGNSFSQDATRYLHDIGRADNQEVTVASLYIGGCPLDRHFKNAMADKEAEHFTVPNSTDVDDFKKFLLVL